MYILLKIRPQCQMHPLVFTMFIQNNRNNSYKLRYHINSIACPHMVTLCFSSTTKPGSGRSNSFVSPSLLGEFNLKRWKYFCRWPVLLQERKGLSSSSKNCLFNYSTSTQGVKLLVFTQLKLLSVGQWLKK